MFWYCVIHIYLHDNTNFYLYNLLEKPRGLWKSLKGLWAKEKGGDSMHSKSWWLRYSITYFTLTCFILNAITEYFLFVSQKLIKFNRDFENFKTACIPWESRIKEVESLFISVYFLFYRNPAFSEFSVFLILFSSVYCHRSLWVICCLLLHFPAVDVWIKPGSLWLCVWACCYSRGEMWC